MTENLLKATLNLIKQQKRSRSKQPTQADFFSDNIKCVKKKLKCFCKLCITEAVRCNREFATATDKSMEDIIKEWFRYAKDLDGGREEKTSKKNKNKIVATEVKTRRVNMKSYRINLQVLRMCCHGVESHLQASYSSINFILCSNSLAD